MRKLFFIAPFLFLLSCEQDPEIGRQTFHLDIPAGFPAPNIPEDNSLNWERIDLGKKLFFDPILSVDNSISCSSCHKQEFAFADDQVVSLGVEDRLGNRNSMSLANVAYYDLFLREGGVPTLEMQVLAPIQDHNEMNFNIVDASELLKEDSVYVRMAWKAYDRAPDPYVITRAIAAFERTMISGSSDYDLDRLSSSEERGKDLFFSDSLSCASCHGSFLFTNQGIENNGLYEVYEDSGRYRLTHLEEDIGKFKVPTLRNIELTAPYMHNGSVETLEEVISHYAEGGKSHFNQSELIQGFELSDQEKEDLLAFLNSLTDPSFICNTFFEE